MRVYFLLKVFINFMNFVFNSIDKLEILEEVDVNEVVLEPNTGFHINKYIWDASQELVGTSTRKVTIFKFLTYAFVLYVDRKKLKHVIENNKDNLNGEKILGDIIDDPSDLTLTIIPYREIDTPHFSKSLSERIRPVIKELYIRAHPNNVEESQNYSSTLAKTLNTSFKRPKITPKTRVDFKCIKDLKGERSIEIYIDGKLEDTIKNDIFVQAFVEMFLGDMSTTKNMKTDIENQLLNKFN